VSNPVIIARGLSKRYRIGASQENVRGIRGAITSTLMRPLNNLRRLRKLSAFRDDTQEPEDIIWALKDVSFDVEQGEVVGIIGRNGAGKSTLLKIVSRITKPTTGYADIYGRVGALLEVGTGFHPELTGRENVYLNGAILGMRKAEISKKFDEIVDFSGVERFIDTPVKRYSTGMKVRLAFAVAANLDPEVLIIDEVLSVGDAEFQKKSLGKMDEFASGGRTVLFVSHNMSAVARLCHRAILLEDGQIVADGPAPQVTSTYVMGAEGATGSRTWTFGEAPGGEELKITSVSLLGSDGSPAVDVEVTEPLQLRIGYYVGKSNLRFRCVAEFFTQGVMAFSSVEPREEERPAIGNYYSTLSIPCNLLAEGQYSVRIAIFTSSLYTTSGMKHSYAQLSDALIFHMYDRMDGSSARGDYAQNFPGVMHPRLDWQLAFDGDGATRRP